MEELGASFRSLPAYRLMQRILHCHRVPRLNNWSDPNHRHLPCLYSWYFLAIFFLKYFGVAKVNAMTGQDDPGCHITLPKYNPYIGNSSLYFPVTLKRSSSNCRM